MSCICFKFFSLSFKIKLITEAGIKAKPMETTNTMNTPLADAALYLSFSVTGNEEVTTSNLKSLLFVACFKIASYMN